MDSAGSGKSGPRRIPFGFDWSIVIPIRFFVATASS